MMTLRHAVSALAIALSLMIAHGGSLTPESARATLASLPLQQVEGLWQLTADGTTIMIIRSDTLDTSATVTRFDIVLVESPDRSLRPGTRLGTLSALAQPLTYDGRLLLTSTGRLPSAKHPKRFTLKLEDDAHLSLRHVKSGVQISPTILVRWGYRSSVKVGTNRADNLDGFIKTFPEVPIKGAPRHL